MQPRCSAPPPFPSPSFAVVTALAELFGAANLGTAATFGQIAFIIAVGA